MNLEQIKDKALQLSEADRSKLALKLLVNLGALSELEVAEDWFMEAQRRAWELDAGTVRSISAEEASRKALALLR